MRNVTVQSHYPQLTMAKKKAKKKKNWIAGAIKHPGALTRKAKAQGMSPRQFCAQPKAELSPQSQKQCNLMKTLKRF